MTEAVKLGERSDQPEDGIMNMRQRDVQFDRARTGGHNLGDFALGMILGCGHDEEGPVLACFARARSFWVQKAV